MADNKNIQVTVSGITPAKTGKDAQYGNWFLIDQSGDFSVDKPIIATIWIVGGGCDGTAGVWNGNDISSDGNPIPDTGTDTSYSGAGGDGGYVLILMNVKIPANQTLTSVIAERNDKSGTTLTTDSFAYRCNQSGSICEKGGAKGSIPLPPTGEQWADQNDATTSGYGTNGVNTPYGWVGSSGGGGAVCNGKSNASNGVVGGNGAGSGTNHRAAGTNAVNYGCGGGGGAICGWIAQGQVGGLGKQGCIIIAYTIEQKPLIVQKHYKRVCNTHKTCNTDYYSNNSRKTCCGNGGCSCGNSKSANASDYIDTIHISSSNKK